MNRLPIGICLQGEHTRTLRVIRVVFDNDSIHHAVYDVRTQYTICSQFVVAVFGNPDAPARDQFPDSTKRLAHATILGGRSVVRQARRPPRGISLRKAADKPDLEYNAPMSVYEASVEHAFNARHAVRLPNGSWEVPHSHLWRVTATFRAEDVDQVMGVVIDFLDVQRALEKIDERLQGEDLNKLPAFEGTSPSAERVAEHIAAQLGARLGPDCGLYRLKITEAPGCSAAFYPGPQEPT